LHWKHGTNDTLDALPVRDSILAICDAGYFDWPVLPEAPSGLSASPSTSGVALRWALHDGNPSKVAIERRTGNNGAWQRISTIAATSDFEDTSAPGGSVVCYRVRAMNGAGESAYSNIVRIVR
jgi:hypothetical protein